jgi:hypothetical protein
VRPSSPVPEQTAPRFGIRRVSDFDQQAQLAEAPRAMLI